MLEQCVSRINAHKTQYGRDVEHFQAKLAAIEARLVKYYFRSRPLVEQRRSS